MTGLFQTILIRERPSVTFKEKMYSTVTEYSNGIISTPKIFSNSEKAEKYFQECVVGNRAILKHTDEFNKVACRDSYYIVSLEYQVEITR